MLSAQIVTLELEKQPFLNRIVFRFFGGGILAFRLLFFDQLVEFINAILPMINPPQNFLMIRAVMRYAVFLAPVAFAMSNRFIFLRVVATKTPGNSVFNFRRFAQKLMDIDFIVAIRTAVFLFFPKLIF